VVSLLSLYIVYFYFFATVAAYMANKVCVCCIKVTKNKLIFAEVYSNWGCLAVLLVLLYLLSILAVWLRLK